VASCYGSPSERILGELFLHIAESHFSGQLAKSALHCVGTALCKVTVAQSPDVDRDKAMAILILRVPKIQLDSG